MSRALLGRRLVWLALAAAVAAVWWGSLDAPLVYDDKIEVIGNRTIRTFDEWRAILGYNLSRPLTILTYAWDFSRNGLDPRGYHVTNIAVHVAAVGAALELAVAAGRLYRIERPLMAGAAAVSVWALHPMVTESVTYTTGRSEALCGAFAALALAAWATALRAEGDGARSWTWRLAAMAAFVGAALSKEVGWAVPGIALLLEITAPRDRGRGASRWAWYLPFAALLGAGVWARLQQAGALLPVEADRTLGVQLTTSAEVWLRYLRLWLLPVGQTLFHDQPDVAPVSGRGAVVWVAWGAMVGAGAWLGRRRPATGWALAAAGLTLLPSTSFVVLKEHMAEHRSYQAGFFVLLGLAWLVPAVHARRAAVAAVALAACAAGLTLQRNAVWSDEAALWSEATDRSPASAEAWYGLGDARRFARDFAGARVAYDRATQLAPDHLDAWNNLGIAAAEVGDADEARRAWKQALRVKPSYCKGHNNLGSLAYREQDWDEAIGELRSTLAYCPGDPIAHYLLGNIYYGPRRDADRAIAHYEEVIRIAPDFDHAALIKKRLLELTW